ncbi:valine--tRNA ligase [Patescibacteria group bacterium]|nr:valine--tRNA ligase [Patescibacteria group bacterium]
MAKYNFKEKEKHWQNFWAEEKIYQFNPQSQKSFYTVDTPPPTVSADYLHAGHIMSYSQAEFIVRYKRMRGFEVYYPMGFDDNGLPTERYVEKKYNLNKNNINRAEFIKKCLAETKIAIQTYRNLWQILGISVDWTKTYSTINQHSQRISQWSFLDLFKKGKLIHKDDPVYWCTNCQTALAQADLEDTEESSFLNYLTFKTKDNKEFLIATSRPELLPACVALFFNPKDERYKKLAGKKAQVPLFNQQVPILADEDVDIDYGTGLMMVCTWGDIEDVKKCRKYDLTYRAVFTQDGKLNELAKEFAGLKIDKARQEIIKKLKAEGFLKKQEEIIHVLNTHERCKTPVEFIKTKQWFIDILSVKNKLLAQINKLKWYPSYMKKRAIDWINALNQDWCISRQRFYGVPFPVWYCQQCGEVIVAQEKDLPIDPLQTQPSNYQCAKCKSNKLIPEKDIMDTWMTSSVTPLIIAGLIEDKAVQKKLYPINLRPQAFEIIRTWLFYTVVKSYYHHQSLPFYEVMISGHGLDDKGQKISKRLGNFIPAEKIVEKYGADAVRYWATGSTLGENLRYNEQEIKKGSRTVTKLYNAAQFCFLHFKKDDYSKLKIDDLLLEDKWILHYLNQTVKNSVKYFDNYQYSKARDEVDNFLWHYFCDNYLEFVKHRLYQNEPDKKAKTVLSYCLLAIIKMYAPIMPFIAEEIYNLYFADFVKTKSIHLTSWPEIIKNLKYSSKETEEFEKVLSVIRDIRKYKSEKQISLGEEVGEYTTSIKLSENNIEFIKQVAKVKEIIVK